MSIERSRITLLTGLAVLCIGAHPLRAWGETPPTVTVYKNPT